MVPSYIMLKMSRFFGSARLLSLLVIGAFKQRQQLSQESFRKILETLQLEFLCGEK